jgi:hypothetical protein
MRTSGLAVAVATILAGLGCFSTARYDTAHVQRVVDIHARYDAEARRLDGWYASRVAALAQLRAAVIAIKTSSHADETWVTQQLLASTHPDLESILAFAHNRTLLQTIDQQTTTLEQQRRAARQRLDLARESEIRASLQRRDTDIASGRAARRARVKAKAEAFDAKHRPLSTLDRMTYAPRASSHQPADTAQ